jgi:metal-responsive CopG/Arc/MetJ family transcriptional regulator
MLPISYIGGHIMKAKAHVVLNSDILDEIDRIAGKRRRSLFIEEATREKLEKEKFLKVLEETKGSWSDKSHPELRTSRDVEQYVKEKRRSYQKRLKRIVNE